VKRIVLTSILTLSLGGCVGQDTTPPTADELAPPATAPLTARPWNPQNPLGFWAKLDNDCVRLGIDGSSAPHDNHLNFNLEQTNGDTLHDDNVLVGVFEYGIQACGLYRGNHYNAKIQDCRTGGGICLPWTEIPLSPPANEVIYPSFEEHSDLQNYTLFGNAAFGVETDGRYTVRGSHNAFISATQPGWSMLSQYIYLEPDKDYLFSAWIEENEILADAYMGVHDADTDEILGIIRLSDGDDRWESQRQFVRWAVPFHTPPHALAKRVRIDIGYTAPAGRRTWMRMDDLYVGKTENGLAPRPTQKRHDFSHDDRAWFHPWIM